MKVLVIGGGGRCHAIVEKVSESPLVEMVFCAPGNAGMKNLATLVNISDSDIFALRDFALENKIDLTIVGPEIPLSKGIVDEFDKVGLKAFGPTKSAARIESSKQFAKELMKKYQIPTAEYQTFTDFTKAKEYIEKVGAPVVLKFDGLAYGKGVVVAENLNDAVNTAREMLEERVFGEGAVVIEEFLSGAEFSFMCLVNGEIVLPLDLAQDHKREGDGDTGSNTGGMGAYSPVPFVTKEDVKFAMENVMKPVASAMVKEGCPFCGVLYGGLMKTNEGIKVIEFNARFGDPETEVILPRMESDLVDVIVRLMNNEEPQIVFDKKVSLGVVLASKGYPRKYEKGAVIGNLENVQGVFHMGTKEENGQILTNGGRVLFVLGRGESFAEARADAYEKVKKISCDKLYCRKDIGYQAINFIGE